MQTFLDCIPCFFKQALEGARLAGSNEKTQKELLDKISGILPDFPLTATPPEMGLIIHRIIKELIQNPDPYYEIKQKSNRLALSIYNDLKKKVRNSTDQLKTAVELAIAGNIIDYGVKNSIDVEKEAQKILKDEKKAILNEQERLFNYKLFKKEIEKAKSILYLGDNAGEIVFDRILIEHIKDWDKDKKIIFAVRDKPIINDAVMEDAVSCGLDKVAQIISSGCETPATVLSGCSKKFLNVFKNADIVISKGQGNFEGLSGEKRSIFFLFMVKCPVVSEHIGAQVGDFILFNNLSNIKKGRSML